MGRRTWRRGAAGLAVVAVATALGGCAEDVGTPPGLGSARAVAVNAGGVALVEAWPSGGSPGPEGSSAWTLTPAGTWAEVVPLGAEPGDRVVPAAIDDGGTVVGSTWGPDEGYDRATGFVRSPSGEERALEGLPGTSAGDDVGAHPTDVGDDGTVVGYDTGDGFRAVRWAPGASEPVELARPAGWSYARAVAINDSGVVVGYAEDSGQYSAVGVVWEPPAYAPRELGLLGPSYLTDIDDDGTIVGYRQRRMDGPYGVRWAPDGQVTELGYGFVPQAVDDGTMVGGPNGSGAWVWPAGAEAPESMGTTSGRRAYVTDIAGGHMVGRLETFEDAHAARFTRNP